MDKHEIHIKKAEQNDLQEILDLQYFAYRTEAERINDFTIPPLTQTLDEVSEEYKKGTVLKAEQDGKIVGSVRGHTENGTLYVGKLMVHQNFRRRGLGTQLLAALEKEMPHNRCELFTGKQSAGNIRLYEKNGYRKFGEKVISPSLAFVFLEK